CSATVAVSLIDAATWRQAPHAGASVFYCASGNTFRAWHVTRGPRIRKRLSPDPYRDAGTREDEPHSPCSSQRRGSSRSVSIRACDAGRGRTRKTLETGGARSRLKLFGLRGEDRWVRYVNRRNCF